MPCATRPRAVECLPYGERQSESGAAQPAQGTAADLEQYVRMYLETVLPYGSEEAKRVLELLEAQRIIREGEAEHRAGRTKRLRSLRAWRGKKSA